MGVIPSVTISGGEPFLRNDLPEICKIFEKNNKTESVIIPTNCLLPKRIDNLTERVLKDTNLNVLINLSLDGIGKKHDLIRGVKGNFKKVLETYSVLKKLQKKYDKLLIGVNTTISNYNEGDADEIAKFVKKNLKVCNHIFEAIRGYYDTTKVSPPSVEKYSEIIKKILPIPPNNSLVHSYYYKIALKTMEEKRQVIPCMAGRINPKIDSYGNVYLCEILPPIGNLRKVNYDFKQIWNSKKAEEVRKKISNGKCFCTHICYQHPSILYNPPTLLKAVVSYYVNKLLKQGEKWKK